eukprot:gnl/Dysnectes_brevis/3776_a4855_901.p1 GENE.gnl/Dysnectes_brevis/3776_a4855_901~~gnl/Dysnectes_brevis/3776_a4855_901.p1  ORF type:complete len:347 (+),score=30.63 gnl/Dysnectes_brevis/3776_a4855_901:217-1257(+)
MLLFIITTLIVHIALCSNYEVFFSQDTTQFLSTGSIHTFQGPSSDDSYLCSIPHLKEHDFTPLAVFPPDIIHPLLNTTIALLEVNPPAEWQFTLNATEGLYLQEGQVSKSAWRPHLSPQLNDDDTLESDVITSPREFIIVTDEGMESVIIPAGATPEDIAEALTPAVTKLSENADRVENADAHMPGDSPHVSNIDGPARNDPPLNLPLPDSVTPPTSVTPPPYRPTFIRGTPDTEEAVPAGLARRLLGLVRNGLPSADLGYFLGEDECPLGGNFKYTLEAICLPWRLTPESFDIDWPDHQCKLLLLEHHDCVFRMVVGCTLACLSEELGPPVFDDLSIGFIQCRPM